MDQSVGDEVLERPRVARRSVIIADDPEAGLAIATRAETRFDPRRDRSIVRYVDGKLAGGVIYVNYTGASAFLHMAGFVPGWCTKELLVSIFHFPFVTLRCGKLFAQVPQWKTDALNYDLRVGFKVETFIEGVYKEGGVFLLSMLREECRWVDPNE